MSNITKTIIYFVVCAVMGISVAQSASACRVDDFYLTKEGALAASTQETLNDATRLEEEGNKDKLADLIKSGMALRFTGDIKVQVLERSVEFKTLKIKFLEGKELYWVKDGSLKQVKCVDGVNR
jgi:hypothetical protein